MVKAAEADQIDEDHPLVLEISSLKAAVARFQDEAHNASLKLQRFSFDTSTTQDRVTHLTQENELLKHELSILRAHPHPDAAPASHPAVLQSQELTLSLRRLSDKLSLTEQALLERTTELAHATSEVAKSRTSVEGAYALAARTRGREEEGKVRERQLEMKIRELEEQMKMQDLVVNEYANLVRSLEGRSSTASSNETVLRNGLIDSLSQGKAGLRELFLEFSSEHEKLEAEVERLRGELAATEARCEAEVKGAEADRVSLAAAQKELEMLKVEDKSAAGMVSRYMKFSQNSSNTLQNSLSTLKTRHSATIDTLSNQLTSLSAQLHSSQTASDKLRATLDELGKDIMREAFGRRREIALRLRMVVREEGIQEGLGRWIRRAQEALDRESEVLPRAVLEKMIEDARTVYAIVDTPSSSKGPILPKSDPSRYSPYSSPAGSLARIIAAEASAKSLIEELQMHTARRLELEQALANSHERPPPVPVKDIHQHANDHAKAVFPESESSSIAFKSDVHRNDVGGRDVSMNITIDESPTSKDVQEPANTEPVDDVSAVLSQVVEQSHSFNPPPFASPAPTSASSLPPVEPVHLELDVQDTAAVTQPNGEDSSMQLLHHPVDVPENQSPHMTSSSTDRPNSIMQTSAADIPVIAPGPIAFPSQERQVAVQPIPGSSPDTQLKTEPSPEPHPLLLEELKHVSHRYDELQRAFRDCHLALQDLKRSVSSVEGDGGSMSHTINGVSSQIFQTAVERLDDYTEDARVELEIRVADEALLAQGYETMLCVPGALLPSNSALTSSSPSILHPSPSASSTFSFSRTQSQDSEQDAAVTTLSDLELQIRAFTSGTDPTVQRAHQSLSRKLVDVQHDIAALKRAVHDPDAMAISSVPSPTTTPSGVDNSSGSAGWTSWIRGASSSPRPSSPAPAPTFGNVMTSPRLRHASSFNHGPAVGNVLGKRVPELDSLVHPFASLGLRIAMPALPSTPAVTSPPPVGVDRNGPRTRTVSTMYMLGLGAARSTSGNNGRMISSPQSSPQRPRTAATPSDVVSKDDESDEENEDNEEEDVE